mmetsp:Transcript_25378/g.37606  ORF Transcript_25378/g.37606 Transcript_25378/m.37606 type:complete len:717 (+) Transcript_25378:1050-3200(+)
MSKSGTVVMGLHSSASVVWAFARVRTFQEEEEEEEEVVVESAKKKKYSRDDEHPKPWPVAGLAKLRKATGKDEISFASSDNDPDLKGVSSWEHSFYPVSKFSVKNYLFSKASSVEFPDFVYVSNNYYKRSWSMKTHRRLKNIIVFMDFAPSKAAMIQIADVGRGFTPIQENNLRKAFQGADRGSGGISIGELKEVLKAVDVGLEGEDGANLLANLPPNGTFSFDQLKTMLQERLNYRNQANRHYVGLCLAEAECMRAAIHNQSGMPLVPGKDTIVSLRTEKTVLDCSTGYEKALPRQDATACVCFKFIDSGVNYNQAEVSLLLRALQTNPCAKRETYFAEVRSNRRRKEIDPATTSLAKVFVTADEHHMLQYRIAKGRVTALLKSKGLFARDAFAAFDHDRDGLLSHTELRRGLEWLGMKMDHSLVSNIMKEVDKDKDGFINLEEFKSSVGWDESSADSGVASTFNAPALPPPMPTNDGKEGNRVKIPIPEQVLASIKIKIKKVSKFQCVWTSHGTMSRQQTSVWEPVVGAGAFRANRAYVSLGHYVGTGYESPARDGKERLTLEITDTQGSFVGGSGWLSHVLDKFMPRPARFRLAWSLTHGNNPFYAWEPIPPSEQFVAMGFVGTTTENPPDVRMMRCVCKDFLMKSNFVKKVWDDSGSGGREGSIWVFNTMNLVGFVSGHDPPTSHPWDLRSRRFFLRDFTNIKNGGSFGPSR